VTCNVLLSSAGRRVALLRCFREALQATGQVGRVVATDVSRTSSAFHAADAGVVVPRCTTNEFLPAMLEVCREHEIRLVVPTIDTELPVLAANRDLFAARGVTVAVSEPSTIAIGADKVLTHEWLVGQGLPTVRQADPATVAAATDEWPYPLMVKPRLGSASIGVAVVADPIALEVATRAGDFVVQTLAAGHEHTVDVYVDRRGIVLEAVPRRRLEVRGGEVSKAVTTRLPEVEDLAREIARRLPGAFGALNVQLFRDEDTGALAVIEVNARFGGGYPLADAAGATFPRWLVEDATGLPRSEPVAPWQAGVVMLRYDDAVFVDRIGAGL
jgi:carbamoyl-phosphate synthase large subunit